MARTVYEHLLRLTGDNSGLVRAADGSSNAIKRLDESSRRGQASIERYNTSLNHTTRATTTLARAFGGISAGLVAREFVQAADSMTLLGARLRIVTTNSDELAATQRTLFEVSQDTRASLESTTSFYVRLAQRMGTAKQGALELSEVTSLVSKSLKIGGATAKETSSSLLQLSQALSSGVVRGDEFRSLSENALGLMQAIADGAGITQSKLRELSIAGEFTTEFFLKALEKSAPEIRRQFESIPITFGDALQKLQNIAVDGIDQLNKKFDITGVLVDGITLVGDNIDTLAIGITQLMGLKLRSLILGQAEAFRLSAESASRAAASTEAKTVADRRAAAEVYRVADAINRKNLATVRALTVERNALTADIAREKQLLKTNAAIFGQSTSTARLTTLQQAGVEANRRLSAANGVLAKSSVTAAAAQTALGSQVDFVNRASLSAGASLKKGLGKGLAVLGGPLGAALIALQVGALVYSLVDFGKEVELTASSMETLISKTGELSGKTYDQLLVTQDAIVAEIDWRSEIDSSNEANAQSLKIATELLEVTKGRLLQTKEGAALQFEKNKNDSSSLGIRERELELELKQAASGRDSVVVFKELIQTRKDLKTAVDELTVAEAERAAASTAAFFSFSMGYGLETDSLAQRKATIASLTTEAEKIAEKRVKMAELIAIQKDEIVMETLSADTKKVLAEQIKKLKEEIDGKLKKGKEDLTVTEQLAKKEKELRAEIVLLSAAHKASGLEVSQFSVKLKTVQKALDDQLGIVPDVAKAVEELNKRYRNGDLPLRDYEREVKKLTLTQAEQEAVMLSSGATYDKVDLAMNKLRKSQERQLEIQRIASTDGETAARVYEEMSKFAEKYDLTLDQLIARYPDLIEQQGNFIDQQEGIEELTAAIEDFSSSLADAIVDGEDLGDFFKDLWKKMVKDFLASGITQMIASLAGTNDKGAFSGFTSNSAGSLGQLVGLVTGKGGKTASDPAGSAVGGTLGTLSTISGALGGPTLTSLATSAATSIGTALGIGAAASTTTALASLGATGIIPTAGFGAGAVSSTIAANTAPAFFTPAAAGAPAGAGLGQSMVAAFQAIPGWGQALLAAAAIYAVVGSGARTPQELGEDQLRAVDESTKAGRNEQVQLGNAGSTALSFLGGFDENSTFFGVDLAKAQLQQVGDVLKRFGFEQALALKDGIIRLEDFDRDFSSNNERIVAEVKAAIIEVELSVTELERTTLGSLGGTLVEVNRLFNEAAGNGKTTSENLAQAWATAYDSNIEAGQAWVESTGIDAERIGLIFSTTGDKVTEAMFGVSADSQAAFEATFDALGQGFTGLTSRAQLEARGLIGTYTNELSNLEGYLRGINLGSPQVGGLGVPSIGGRNLGTFASALNGSETINPNGAGIGSSLDKAYSISVNDKESVTVNRKGMIERIEAKLDNINSGQLEAVLLSLAGELSAATKEMKHMRGKPNARG